MKLFNSAILFELLKRNCIFLRKIGAGFLELCKFTLSPSTYIFKNLPTNQEDLCANIQSKNNSKDNVIVPKKFNVNVTDTNYPKPYKMNLIYRFIPGWNIV